MSILLRGSFVDEAIAIGDRLLASAMVLPDASLTWGRGFGVAGDAVVDGGLYNGRSGEAFFLAALYSVTRDRRYHDAALAVLHDIRRIAAGRASSVALIDRIGIGLAGVGSIIYGLVRIGDFLERDDLHRDAAGLASALAHSATSPDGDAEIMRGIAGALVGLSALAERNAAFGALVSAYADQLLMMRTLDEASGFAVWHTDPAVGATAGFAHGNSGIAHALLGAAGRVHEPRYYAAALEAFSYERTLYRESIADWPDHHRAGAPYSSWCHGAPGIAFARLAALPLLRNEHEAEVSRDLFLAVDKTSRSVGGWCDHLCCGNFGRLELMMDAGVRLENRALVDTAVRHAARIVEHRAGAFGVSRRNAPPHDAPGLWQGEAGIGFSLLRLDSPGTLPSLLAFQ